MTASTVSIPHDISDLVAFLDASPSPWHAVASAAARLEAAGFEHVSMADSWGVLPDAGYVVSGAALIAFRLAGGPGTRVTPFRIAGAHTDSPCLRIKPRPDTGGFGWKQLGVEIYGGALLNSWLDRDLGIAGRVVLTDGTVSDIAVHAAICRVPQLAIHLDRDVNDRGVVLDKHQHLTPVWGTGTATEGEFAEWLDNQRSGPNSSRNPGQDRPRSLVAGWELCLFDRTPAALLGADSSLLASGRLDNQVSCWATVAALCHAPAAPHHQVVALFDHEEVGSQSSTGAAGPLLEQVLERIHLARGGDRASFLASLHQSSCVSADNAHAVHPNYPERHDPNHRPMVNHGPAVKLNSNQRYATGASGAADFQRACATAGVPWQVFVGRNNMPCGSTIGPVTATRLGIQTIDVGVPQLSMHSARELCGVEDPVWLAAALGEWFAAS